MRSQLRPAFVVFIALTAITGVAYPAAVTAISMAFMPGRATGSVVLKDGKAVGSALIGQAFTDAHYFWGRPSATTPAPYNASGGSGSNLAPSNPALLKAVQERAAALKVAHPAGGAVPVDLVTASASGLDPDISPAAARYQTIRVAAARGLPTETVQQLVDGCTEGRTLGVLGEPRVNVLKLNLALDGAATR